MEKKKELTKMSARDYNLVNLKPYQKKPELYNAVAYTRKRKFRL